MTLTGKAMSMMSMTTDARWNGAEFYSNINNHVVQLIIINNYDNI